MDLNGQKQRINVDLASIDSLAFEVTLQRLRLSPSQEAATAAAAEAGESTADDQQPLAAASEGRTEHTVDAAGRVQELDQPQIRERRFEVKRTIKWQTKIISRQEVCPR